jgi:hypothetical protein
MHTISFSLYSTLKSQTPNTNMTPHHTTTPRKAVHFDDNSTETVFFCEPSSGSVSPNSLWYSPKDYETFRLDAADKTVGKTYRRQFILALLSQQLEHKKLGIIDPKGLKVLSKACSKGARQIALQLALQNARDIADTAEEKAKLPQSTPVRHRRPLRNVISAVSA